MSAIRIGITQRVVTISKNRICDALEHSYEKFFLSNGTTLIPVPNCLPNTIAFIEKNNLTHIVLSGGDNIRKSAKQTAAYRKPLSPRETTEEALITYAIKKRLPLLGICRGMQALNAYFGGRVEKLGRKYNKSQVNHLASKHRITVSDGRLTQMLRGKIVKVNSYHTDGISRHNLANTLCPFAYADDNSIEGFYHPKVPVAGVMWHPERTIPATKIDTILFKQFLQKRGYWRA